MPGKRWAGACASLCWILWGAALVIRWMAGDGALLSAEMLRFAPPAQTGLPASEYPGVGRMTGEYLTGGRKTFQYTYTDEAGTEILCFHSYEADHMEDCRKLIRLDGWICAAGGLAAAVLTALGTGRKAGWEMFLRGMLTGLRIFAGAASALLIWAAVNFDGLFITFHRAVFRNDGWLLDPRTDLLIRLMPVKFFMALGIRGLLRALAVPILLEGCARIGLKRIREQKR